MINPLLAIDFYKTGHYFQYPEGTTKVYSNFTPRSNRLYKGKSTHIVNFGLQMFIKNFLINTWNEGFFNQPKQKVVYEYKLFMDSCLGVDAVPVTHIAALHDLGYLPLHIKGLPEGTLVPMKIPVLTITNTHPDFFWLVNYIETVMSTELWKPITNATIAYEYKQVLNKYAELTGADTTGIIFQGHDFSARGLSNIEDGYKAGIAHLTSFAGTDTVLAIQGACDFYGADYTKQLVGTSVPATEHSVMALNSKESEINTFRRLITELYPTGIVSIVSDTWDFWKVLTEYTVILKDEILNRQPNSLGLAKVVFRPDSGNPVDIICGLSIVDYKDIDSTTETNIAVSNVPYGTKGKFYATCWEESNGVIKNLDADITSEISEAETKGAIEVLWDIFGGTINSKGYKVLNHRVGLIYGDSITLERQEQILSKLAAKGFDSSNIVFGIGSYTYQYSTRDTFGMAMKATYGVVNEEPREIFKDPVTDSGTKKSAKGLLCVKADPLSGELILVDQVSEQREQGGLLETVFLDGKLVKETTLAEIRARLNF